MQKNPIGWVEIPVTDLDRAEKFYHDLMGLRCKRQNEMNGFVMSWFPMVDNSYGSAGTLIKGDGYKPSHAGPVIYFTAPGGSVAKALLKAEEMGVKILVPRTDIGEHGFFAWIEDSEGNRVALHALDD